MVIMEIIFCLPFNPPILFIKWFKASSHWNFIMLMKDISFEKEIRNRSPNELFHPAANYANYRELEIFSIWFWFHIHLNKISVQTISIPLDKIIN